MFLTYFNSHLLLAVTLAGLTARQAVAAENTITLLHSRELQGGGTIGTKQADVDVDSSDFSNIPSITLRGVNDDEPMVYHKKTLGGAFSSSGDDSWYGEMSGDHDGTATMYQAPDGSIAGSFSVDDDLYQMNTMTDGSVVMDAFNYADFQDDPDENDEDELEKPKEKGTGPTLGGGGRLLRGTLENNSTQELPLLVHQDQVRELNGGAEVHVLVIYTNPSMCAEAKKSSCGVESKAPIEQRIKLAETETNQSYQASGMSTRIKVVHMHYDPNFDELGGSFTKMLNALGRSSDGLEYVRQMRKDVGADLVTLIANGGQWCGYGNVRGPFSVTKRTCATGYYSFGHEIAHNMGCYHDEANSGTKHAFAHGFQDPSRRFRSVMAYNCPGNCARVPMYSTPNHLYQGNPIGSSKADCARQIDLFAPAVSNWMKEVCNDYPDWYDKDGPAYDCDWYAVGDRCVKYGAGFRGVNNMVAQEACCVCKPECEDTVPGWTDRDGPPYDCAWYALNDNCQKYGHGYADSQGRVANTVCCACGGGN